MLDIEKEMENLYKEAVQNSRWAFALEILEKLFNMFDTEASINMRKQIDILSKKEI